MRPMPDQPAIHLVDTVRTASVSFAPPDPVTLGPRGRTPTRAPVAVGLGSAAVAAPDRVRAEPGGGVSYPIQPGKITAPGLRDETLARTRLLDWLDIKIHSRVVFVIADAGYGKTTLLADFSRRTRLRTIWYRLDEEDRDWIGFLSHLVAAGREFEPGFAPRTASILRSLEAGGPTRDDAIETFLEELPSITGDGAALILDDFHLADEIADIRQIARAIVAHGPERLSVVFASRRVPSVPVAKLRSLGELAEIGITDLRFSDAEMEQLFRETYGRPLEPDVLSELAKRTEGWAASLTLVQAALRERTPAETRSFVRGLSGARDELHDYLAEEVVGDLPAIQQQFLMRTSILQRVTPELAQIASGLSSTEVQSMIADAERLGMLGRRASRRSPEQRYHPLVREFLEERLLRAVGASGVDALHVAVAEWAESSDWRTAAHHYASARRWPDLQRVLETHLERIVASGAFSVASDFARMFPDPPRSAAMEVVASRQASVEGDVERVNFHADRAFQLDPENDVVIGTFLSAKMLAADVHSVFVLAETWAVTARSPLMRQIAEATTALISCSIDGDLRESSDVIERLADRSHDEGLWHFEGVSWLNLANLRRAQGLLDIALGDASKAVDALGASSSGTELAAAQSIKACLNGLLGDINGAREEFRRIGSSLRHASRVEALVENADLETLVGDAVMAEQLLKQIDPAEVRSTRDIEGVMEALLMSRSGDALGAAQAVQELEVGRPSPNSAYMSRLMATKALLLTLAGSPTAADESLKAIAVAERQGAKPWRELAMLALAATTEGLSPALVSVPEKLSWTISMAAELVVSRLYSLEDVATTVVRAEAQARPDRWLTTLRRTATDQGSPSKFHAARLLANVGELQDVALLKRLTRQLGWAPRDRTLGRELARSLAPKIDIIDVGKIAIRLGSTEFRQHGIRRKVLALMCFLLTRPRFSATREEAMEALWPAIDPASALNSLNQSVYFLRRVFEPDYQEDTSAGYVHQNADLIWLDDELIDSRSRRCASLIETYERVADPEVARNLSKEYLGRFALDFSYDDWSADYREWLHVSYLRVIERQVRDHVDRGQFDAGVSLARRAVEIDPGNDDLELSLLRLLRSSGAHSAAAEQYSHYSSLLRRDLGVEAPPMDSL
jgi:DNA-binding SARP family transcriptional activator